MNVVRDQNRHYTYADYINWPDDVRVEIIDGVVYDMTPAPSWRHQGISGAIFNILYNYLQDKPCKVFAAPIDVRLNADDEDDTVVQPDIVVVCDKSKLDDHGLKNAPDLAVEILSPSTSRKDKILKFNAYRRAGIREYWIVDPEMKSVNVHILRDGEYYTTVYDESDTVPVAVLEGCNVELPNVFAE